MAQNFIYNTVREGPELVDSRLQDDLNAAQKHIKKEMKIDSMTHFRNSMFDRFSRFIDSPWPDSKYNLQIWF